MKNYDFENVEAGSIGMQSALAFSSHRPGLTEKVGIKVRVFAFSSTESFSSYFYYSEYPFNRKYNHQQRGKPLHMQIYKRFGCYKNNQD